MVELLNNFTSSLVPISIYSILQNTIFLLIIFALLHFFRGAPASIKYLIAFMGIIKLLIPPFIPLSLPFVSDQWAGLTASIYKLAPIDVYPQASSGAARISPYSVIFVIWISVTSTILCYYIFSHIAFLHKLKSYPSKPVHDLPGNHHFYDKVFISSAVYLPITFGYFRKKIYVPETWDSWSSDRKTYILNHEMAHIKRRDSILSLFQIIAQALYFFHPLIWILGARLKSYREMACDDMASGGRIDNRIEYSRILVNIAENMISSNVTVLSASALIRQKSELLQRVEYLMKEENMKSKWKNKSGS